MKYATILAMPDSRKKLLLLEKKLLALQIHGAEFYEAKEEWKRLFDLYRRADRNE